MRGAWLVVLAVLALAGCSAEVTGAPAKDDSPTVGPADLVVPIEMRPVLDSGGTVLKDPGTGESLSLDEPMMTVEHLDGAEIKYDDQNGNNWLLLIHLNDTDTRTFGDWTTEHTGERLAIVIDGEVIVAPTIQSAITQGDIQLVGDFTKDEVQDLLDKITGRG